MRGSLVKSDNRFRSTLTALPVSQSSSPWELLLDSEGRPVWPLWNSGLRNVLANFVEAGGGTLQTCEHARRGMISDDAAMVLGLGAEVADAGRLYAHLTGRQYRTADGLGDLADPSTEVLVAHVDQVTQDVLAALLETDGSSAPGLVVGRGGDDLLRQVLQRSAALAVRWSTKTPRLYIDQHAPFRLRATPLGPVIGRQADAAFLRRILGASAGLLAVTTDSDGVDAYFGDTFVCPLGRRIPEVRDSSAPRCAHTRRCPHFNDSVDASAGQELIGTSEFSGRIVVWNVPFGFPVPGGPLAHSWTLWEALHQNTRIGALITKWSGSPVCSDIDSLVVMLNDGATVGEAVACHNQRREVAESRAHLVVFGDAHMRFRAAPGQPSRLTDGVVPVDGGNGSLGVVGLRDEEPEQELVWHIEDPSVAIAELSVLRHILGSILSRSESPGGQRELSGRTIELGVLKQARAFNASAAALELERALLFRAVPASFMRGLQDSVLAAVMPHGRVERFWSTLVREHFTDLVTCRNCGARASRTLFKLTVSACSDRAVTVCPKCFSTEDATARSDTQLIASPDGRLRLEGTIPSSAWAAKLMIWHQGYLDAKIYDWPLAATGEPMCQWEVPRPRNTAVTRVGVYLMVGTSLSIHTQTIALGRN